MKYLITGGAGFLGTKLIEKLLENKKNKIYVIDNFSKNLKKKTNSKILQNKNIRFIEKNLINISEYLKIYDFDYIFHFAAVLGVQKVIHNPFLTLKDNIQTTANLIDFSKKQKKLKKICFTSTSEVYSYTLEKRLAKYPTPENIDFLISGNFNKRSSYLLSKIVGEHLISYSGLNYIIFRPHNIFGPDMGFSHVIPELTKKILNKKKSSILIRNSNHIRTFCYVDFAIDLIFNISHHNKNSKKIFNIGSPDKAVSIKYLANKIKKILESKNKLSFSRTLQYNSPKRRKPDMNRSLRYTKFKHNFENGLKVTVLWYKNFFSN